MIKHMTYTEEYRLLKEYSDSRKAIIKNFVISFPFDQALG